MSTAVRPSGGPESATFRNAPAQLTAFLIDHLQALIVKLHANWIRVLFSKPRANANNR